MMVTTIVTIAVIRVTTNVIDENINDSVSNNRLLLYSLPFLRHYVDLNKTFNNFARQYLLNGGDFYTLSRILGHSSVKVTESAYMDLTREEIAKKYQQHSPLAKWGIR
jgi:site-specific recombinase XerD